MTGPFDDPILNREILRGIARRNVATSRVTMVRQIDRPRDRGVRDDLQVVAGSRSLV